MSDEQTRVDGKPRVSPPRGRLQDCVLPVLFLNGLGAILSLVGRSGPGPGDPMLVYLAVVVPAPFAIGSLLAIWAAFGGKPHPWRLVLVLVPPAVLASGMLAYQIPVSDSALWLFSLVMQSAVTALVMLGLRLGGARIARPDSASEPLRPRLQFSLRLLLEWTCAIAVLSATLSLFPGDALRKFTHGDELIYIVFFALNALLAMSALGFSLAPRNSGVWLFWLAMAIIVALAVLTAIGGGDAIVELATILSSQSAWMIGSLWPFRLAGFRLNWSRATTARTDGEQPSS